MKDAARPPCGALHRFLASSSPALPQQQRHAVGQESGFRDQEGSTTECSHDGDRLGLRCGEQRGCGWLRKGACGHDQGARSARINDTTVGEGGQHPPTRKSSEFANRLMIDWLIKRTLRQALAKKKLATRAFSCLRPFQDGELRYPCHRSHLVRRAASSWTSQDLSDCECFP